jgi:hypothetical protein
MRPGALMQCNNAHPDLNPDSHGAQRSPCFLPTQRGAFHPATSITSSIMTLVNAVYYPSWRVYKNKSPSCMQGDIVTHVFYAFLR